MSLTHFFAILKGSSKSGNFGHAGIPGHVGGSASSNKILGGLDASGYYKNPTSIGDAINFLSKTEMDTDFVPIFYDFKTGDLIFPQKLQKSDGTFINHEDMADSLTKNKKDAVNFLDSTVHFRLLIDKRKKKVSSMSVDLGEIDTLTNNRDRSWKLLEKTFKRLNRIGASGKVSIYDSSKAYEKPIETTF